MPKKKTLINTFLLILLLGFFFLEGDMDHFYDFTVKDIMGRDVKLETYRGKVVLLVNTASKCGFTPQYDGLQRIYEKYREQGFVVLGFPANNFMKQEPGTNEEIKQFCSINYGVTFPMFAKISVRGKDIHPLFQYLTSRETNPDFSGKITWNFNKFLISRRGKCINRFPSKVTPESPELISALEKALEEK